MEHLNNKTQHLGVMLRAGGLAAVVSQKNTENAGLNYCEKVGWKRRGSFICRSDGR